MKLLVFALALSSQIAIANNDVNWADPPVMCAEDVSQYFKGAIQGAKNPLDANKDLEEKVDIIYDAANDRLMPPLFLLSVIMIENNFVNDGLSYDGGNYSCGLTQINAFEYCMWAQTLDPEEAQSIDWPVTEISKVSSNDICSSDVVHKPVELMMREIRKSKSVSKMNRVDLQLVAKVPYEKIKANMEGDEDLKFARYKAAVSFLKHCQDPKFAIPALAEVLLQLHNDLPSEIKNTSFYQPNEKPREGCRRSVTTPYYPISTSWLIAGAVFNAGDTIIPGLEKYKSKPWSEMQPNDLADLMHFIPTTGELFSKEPYDWRVLDFYVHALINYSALPNKQIVEHVPYPKSH
jgi:hypothetical protein